MCIGIFVRCFRTLKPRLSCCRKRDRPFAGQLALARTHRETRKDHAAEFQERRCFLTLSETLNFTRTAQLTVQLVTVRGRPHSPAVGAFVRAANGHAWAGKVLMNAH